MSRKLGSKWPRSTDKFPWNYVEESVRIESFLGKTWLWFECYWSHYLIQLLLRRYSWHNNEWKRIRMTLSSSYRFYSVVLCLVRVVVSSAVSKIWRKNLVMCVLDQKMTTDDDEGATLSDFDWRLSPPLICLENSKKKSVRNVTL